MKLRNRTKRVLDNIKQEDCKPDLTAVESPTSTTNDIKTACLTIKQEDTKEHKLLLAQRDEPATKDYYYQCDMCNERMANLKAALKHRISIHNVKRMTLKSLKDINVEPDIHDLNFYCKSCEKCYRSKKLFRQHIKRVHYLVLKPLPNHKLPRADAVPDPDDSNSYCRACDYIYSTKHSYRAHCRYAHGMKLAGSTSSGSTIDTYCQACDKRLSSIQSYRQHLVAIHRIDGRMTQQRRSELAPDVNDLNFYCRSCEKILANKDSFNKHLKAVHSIHQSAPRKKSRLEPNINDPNNNCRACQKSYPSRGRYRQHLRLVHQMTLVALRNNTDPLPDPCNPDLYCSACKRMYASLKLYRHHCRRVHFMMLKPFSIINPNATIDINSPERYCSQCEHTFSKSFFKKHLRRVHNIV